MKIMSEEERFYRVRVDLKIAARDPTNAKRGAIDTLGELIECDDTNLAGYHVYSGVMEWHHRITDELE
jgi:hypothetical protein